MNTVSNPHLPPLFTPIPNVFLCLQQKYFKHFFTTGPLLQDKVSKQACASLHRPCCPSRYMHLLWAFGDLSFTEQVHFIWCLNISTSHFLCHPPHWLAWVGNSPLLWHLALQSKQDLTDGGCKASTSVFPSSFVTSSCFTAESSLLPPWQGSSATKGMVSHQDCSGSKACPRSFSEFKPPPTGASPHSGVLT